MYKSDDKNSKLNFIDSHEYKRAAESQITDWQKQIDELKEKGKDLIGDAKSELDSLLAQLEENQKTFGDYLSDLADRAEDQWDDLKDDAEEKWSSFNDSVQKIFSKFS